MFQRILCSNPKRGYDRVEGQIFFVRIWALLLFPFHWWGLGHMVTPICKGGWGIEPSVWLKLRTVLWITGRSGNRIWWTPSNLPILMSCLAVGTFSVTSSYSLLRGSSFSFIKWRIGADLLFSNFFFFFGSRIFFYQTIFENRNCMFKRHKNRAALFESWWGFSPCPPSTLVAPWKTIWNTRALWSTIRKPPNEKFPLDFLQF